MAHLRPFVRNRWLACLLSLALAAHGQAAHSQPATPPLAVTPPVTAAPSWRPRLLADLARIDADSGAQIGVDVRSIDTGTEAAYKADERWYLASMVKLPVAITVLRAVEAGEFTLDTPVTLRAAHYVDGAGSTNVHPVGSALNVRDLLARMVIESDNTAADVLIDLVGVDRVNALVAALVPEGGFERITSLGETRRLIYGHLTPGAERLTGRELIALHRLPTDGERLRHVAAIVGTPLRSFDLPTLDAAYEAYYASGVNSGRLDAYARLLTLLVDGQALGPTATAELLGLMQRVTTGQHRLKAGLPVDSRLAHKTGTQRRRICDAGIVFAAPHGRGVEHDHRVVIVACARGDVSPERAESALRQIGSAVCRSGLLTQGVVDAPSCPPDASARRLPAADLR